MIIREMKKEDADRILEIYKEGIESSIATFTENCPSYPQWDENHCKFCRFVCEIDGFIAGFIAVSPTSKREVYRGVVEVSLYIDKNYHRKGIGTLLLNHLIKVAPDYGIWSIYSAILETNPASVALHKKCAFREIGYRERIAKDRNGLWQNTIIMEKRL